MNTLSLSPSSTIATKGYVRLDPLPAETVRAARAEINRWIAAGMDDPARSDLGRARLLEDYVWNSYGDETLRGAEQVRDCFRPLLAPIRRAFGDDATCGSSALATQVALRFPGSVGIPHVDGLMFGQEAPFEVPAGVVLVYLSDVGPADAPFTVWPQAMTAVREIARRCLDGYPWPRARRELHELLNGLSFEEGAEQVTGPAGTVLLTHPALPHCNGPAQGPDVRYALLRRYYRSPRYDDGGDLLQTCQEAMGVLCRDLDLRTT